MGTAGSKRSADQAESSSEKAMSSLMSQDQKQQEEKLEIFIPNGPRLRK